MFPGPSRRSPSLADVGGIDPGTPPRARRPRSARSARADREPPEGARKAPPDERPKPETAKNPTTGAETAETRWVFFDEPGNRQNIRNRRNRFPPTYDSDGRLTW